MASIASQYVRRALTELANETSPEVEDVLLDEGASEALTESSDDLYEFNSRVFWAVNAFISCVFLFVLCWCCFGNKDFLTNMHERREETDRAYQATVREREERRKRARTITPEQRRRKLLQSFRRHKVVFTVQEDDLIADDPCAIHKPSHDDLEASMTSFNNHGQLRLPTKGVVPNCCAICLGDYEVGDEVVWSSNEECPHAFHKDCILDWLIKMQPETPCPCCRQEFTDLETLRKEAKIVWAGDAFNFSNIRL